MGLRSAGLALALWVGLTGGAIAQSECRHGLQPDIVNWSLNQETALAFLWLATDEEFEQRKSRNKGSLGIPKLSAHFDGEKSQARRRQRLEELGYSFDEKTSMTYFATRVSDAARSEYFKCLQSAGTRQPFFVDIKQNFTSGNGRSMELRLRRVPVVGVPPGGRFDLLWESSDPVVQARLQSAFPVLSDNTDLPFIFDLSIDSGISIAPYLVRNGERLFGAVVFVPPVPKIKEIKDVDKPIVTDDVWKGRIILPVRVRTHLPHTGNRSITVDFRDAIVTANSQEIELSWDDTAWQTSKVPSLSREELNFEYRCGFINNPFTRQQHFYPSQSAYLPAGRTCGNQDAHGGSPILNQLAVRLTGSKKARFKVRLSCRGPGGWVEVVPEAGCFIPSGIHELKFEIASLGSGN